MDSSFLPGVVRAEYVKDYVLDVTFNDGTQKLIDLSQWFKGPVFTPLKKKSSFKRFFIEAGAIAWPSGVDISPEALYEADDLRKRNEEGGSRNSHGKSARRKGERS